MSVSAFRTPSAMSRSSMRQLNLKRPKTKPSYRSSCCSRSPATLGPSSALYWVARTRSSWRCWMGFTGGALGGVGVRLIAEDGVGVDDPGGVAGVWEGQGAGFPRGGIAGRIQVETVAGVGEGG